MQELIAVGIGLQGAIERQHVIELGDDIGQTGGVTAGHAMKDKFYSTDHGHQREGGFYKHEFVPGVAPAELEIGRRSHRSSEPAVCQDNGLTHPGLDQRQEDLVVHVGRAPISGRDLASVIEQPAQLHADDPAPVALAFPADLALTATLASRMDQLDTIAVECGEKGGVSQEALAPSACVANSRNRFGTLRQTAEQHTLMAL